MAMKKLALLALIVAAGWFVWNQTQKSGTGPLDDLRQRLDAAEQSFQQAGRAASVSGVDTTSGADAALHDVEQVERELHALQRDASSGEKEEITRLLARASDLKRRMG
jgi:hypothetical protein